MNPFIKYLFVNILLLPLCIITAQTIDLHINGIRNTKGQLCLAIFVDEAGFKLEKTCWNLKCGKNEIVNGKFNIQIPFHAGVWGFSVLDDENNSGKLEYSVFGIPLEGFGFSDYFLKGLHKPVFNDFSFKLVKNETKMITVKLKYF